jgi:hypothetical protein
MLGLIDKATALYFEPESIGSPSGARCGICWKFNPVERLCCEVDGGISAARGICGLYVNGEPVAHKLNVFPSRKVSKQEAGYTEQGPTHCGNCDEMIVRAVYTTSPCKKVVGLVDGRACCGLWEPAKAK